MKVRIDFTIEIPDECLDNLKELAGEADDLDTARRFVKMDVEDSLIHYLSSNGVDAEVIRRA